MHYITINLHIMHAITVRPFPACLQGDLQACITVFCSCLSMNSCGGAVYTHVGLIASDIMERCCISTRASRK